MPKERKDKQFISKIIKIGRRGEIIIPKDIRELLGIKKGDELFIIAIKSKESGIFGSGRIIMAKSNEIVNLIEKVLSPLINKVKKK